MADLVGKTILHYRIIEQIGQGGMGVVFTPLDKQLSTYTVTGLNSRRKSNLQMSQAFLSHG